MVHCVYASRAISQYSRYHVIIIVIIINGEIRSEALLCSQY